MERRLVLSTKVHSATIQDVDHLCDSACAAPTSAAPEQSTAHHGRETWLTGGIIYSLNRVLNAKVGGVALWSRMKHQ